MAHVHMAMKFNEEPLKWLWIVCDLLVWTDGGGGDSLHFPQTLGKKRPISRVAGKVGNSDLGAPNF